MAFSQIQGQSLLTWMTLSQTLPGEDPQMPGYYNPRFPPDLELLNGKEVIITGYAIPLDVEANTYALSKTPFANCFFCGKAGIETVLGLKFANKQSRFNVDQFIVVKGILRLNKQPDSGFIYYLDQAQLHK